VPLPVGTDGYLELIRADTMPVTMTGIARFADGTTTEFSKNGAIAFPNIPQLIVYESQAAKYGDEGLDVTFYLRLVNENPFGTVVDTATYQVFLDGKMVREGTAGIGIRLPQGSVQEYEVNTSIDRASFGADYAKYLEMDAFPYEVRGEVVVGGMKVPFSHEGSIEL
jgi:LEA14-like dessication related protein